MDGLVQVLTIVGVVPLTTGSRERGHHRGLADARVLG